MGKGWHGQSRRHSLASRGIKTASNPTHKAMAKFESMNKLGLKFYGVTHSPNYPDDAKTYIIEATQYARLLAKNPEDAKRQVKEAYGTGVLDVMEIKDKQEIIELKKKVIEQTI